MIRLKALLNHKTLLCQKALLNHKTLLCHKALTVFCKILLLSAKAARLAAWRAARLTAGLTAGLIAGLSAGLIAGLFCGYSMEAYAAPYHTEIPANIDLGQVAIRLTDLELDAEGREVPMEKEKQVLPGQTVSRIIRIENLGNDAWIRAALHYPEAGSEFPAANKMHGYSDEEMIIEDPNWIKCGGYWYYTKPVPTGETVDFLHGFRVPADWDSRYAGLAMQICATVDAVQIQNFTPDFQSPDPWFGTLIEERVYEPFTMREESDIPLELSFVAGTEGFVRNTEDFMSQFGTLLPGDVKQGRLEIANHYSRPVRIWFSAENDADDELVRELELTIKNGAGKVLYEGPLDRTKVSTATATLKTESEGRVSLGTFQKGESTYLDFELRVPARLTNRYALSKTHTKWIFEAELLNTAEPVRGKGGRNEGVVIFRETDPAGNTELHPAPIPGVLISETPGAPLYPESGAGNGTGFLHKTGDRISRASQQVLGAARRFLGAAKTGDDAIPLSGLVLLLGSGIGMAAVVRFHR